MLYRLCKDTFVRHIGDYGYAYSQLTKHDRTYGESGREFLEALSRKPQSLDVLLEEITQKFSDVSADELKSDLQEFLQSLEQDRYIVSGQTEAELNGKEPSFTYSENPKTAIYNYMQNPDDAVKYADTTEVLLAEYLERPRIHACQIELTSTCNERCLHCYIPHEYKTEILPYTVIENVLKQLNEIGILGLTLSGGEALMHPDIAKILRKARELDFSTNLLTNLTLLTPKLIKVLKETNPSLVQTSLYSIVPEEHDHITKLKGSFAKTAAAIDALIAENISVQISCPVMKSNFRSYKNVLQYAQDRKCKAQTDFIMMARYDFSTDNLNERLDEKETEELIRDIMVYDKDYGELTDTPVKEKSREEIAKEAFCGVGRDNLCIASSGVVYPCSGWQGMALGNVKEQPIKDIWERSPKMLELRSITKGNIPECLVCEDKQFCAQCLVRNFNESNGDYLKVNPHFCRAAKINRKVVEEMKK
jgi:radical SAM protein with 4Fe4S-binding SPASM domain